MTLAVFVIAEIVTVFRLTFCSVCILAKHRRQHRVP
jgi:hypothetical protein